MTPEEIEKLKQEAQALKDQIKASNDALIVSKQNQLKTLGYKRPMDKLNSIPVLDMMIDEQKYQNQLRLDAEEEAKKNEAAKKKPAVGTPEQTTEETVDADGNVQKQNKIKLNMPNGETLEGTPTTERLNWFRKMHLVVPNRVPAYALVIDKQAHVNMHPPTKDSPTPFLIA